MNPGQKVDTGQQGRRLTVLQVLPALESGGVERGTLEVAAHLERMGHRSLVVSGGGRMVSALERGGSQHFLMDVGRKHPMVLRHVRPLRRLFETEAVDIVHARSRLPAWVVWWGLHGLAPARRPRFVTTLHGQYSVNRYSAIMTRGERVIAVSETMRDYALNAFPGLDPERIRVIHRGVDAAEYPSGYQPSAPWLAKWHEDFPHLVGKRLLLLPGRLTRLKGHEDFLDLLGRVASDFPDVHGLIVGGADARAQGYLESLRNRVLQANLNGRVTFTGVRDDLREILAISTIVYSLSNKPESFGRTTLEALAIGMPVLGYGYGGVAEQLERFLPEGSITPRDLDALEERTRAWLRERPCPRMVPEFSLQSMLEKTLAVYRELVPD